MPPKYTFYNIMPIEGRQWNSIATDSQLEFSQVFLQYWFQLPRSSSPLHCDIFIRMPKDDVAHEFYCRPEVLFSHEHPTTIFFCMWFTAVYGQFQMVQEFWAISYWFMTDSITAVLVSMKLKCPHTAATAHCPVTGFWFLTCHNCGGIRNTMFEFMIMVHSSVQQKFILVCNLSSKYHLQWQELVSGKLVMHPNFY